MDKIISKKGDIKRVPLYVQGLDENMEAAKHNFLLKGFFNKKARAAEKKAEEEKK